MCLLTRSESPSDVPALLPNEQDAWAGLEDPDHKSVGSMGYLADSGRAYYVTLLGK